MNQFTLQKLLYKSNKSYYELRRFHSDIMIIWTKASLNLTFVLFQKEEIVPKTEIIRFRKNQFFQCLVFFEMKLTTNHSYLFVKADFLRSSTLWYLNNLAQSL